MLPIWLWGLLLGFVAVGLWLHYRQTTQPSISFASHYFSGLNYLLNDQDDKAVAVFIEMLAVDSNTVEMHLIVGSLFRRRGEVDKAIRIHQNLIARPQLSNIERYEALLALGRDYLAAGFLDRAERIFEQCIKANNEQAIQAMYYLLDIYQQEKSWLQAIDIAQKIHQQTGKSMQSAIAHHYCELAEQAFLDDAKEDIKRYISKALRSDVNLVRASLLQARYKQYRHRYKEAIEIYQKIIKKNPDYISEVISDLFKCHTVLNTLEQAVEFIKTLDKKPDGLDGIMLMAHFLREQQSSEALMEWLNDQLSKEPSLVGLAQLLFLYQSGNHFDKTSVAQIEKIIHHLLEREPHYRCCQCGFVSRTIIWYCPSCKRWSTLQPLSNRLACLINKLRADHLLH